MAGRGSIHHVSQILDLFTDGRSSLKIEDIESAVGLTRSTAYRTIKALTETGFLDRVSENGYALGPRIFELYRQLELSSPLLAAARPAMVALASTAAKGSAVLLCRAYRDQVMCIHQEITYGPQDPVSFQVGRPMPLYRGSSSVVVLAHLERPRLLRLYERDHDTIGEAGLGTTREQYLATLKAVRRTGHLVTHGEVDRGRIGVAAGFVQKSLGITGSISLVLSGATSTEVDVSRAIVQVVAAAHEISAKLRDFEAATKPAAHDIGTPAAIA